MTESGINFIFSDITSVTCLIYLKKLLYKLFIFSTSFLYLSTFSFENNLLNVLFSVKLSKPRGKLKDLVLFSKSSIILFTSSFILSIGVDKFLIDSETISVKLLAFSFNSSYLELYKLISLLTILSAPPVIFSKKSGIE